MNSVMLDEALLSKYSVLRQSAWEIISRHQHVINIRMCDFPDDLIAITDNSLPKYPRQIRLPSLTNLNSLPQKVSATFSCQLRIPDEANLNLSGLQLAWDFLLQANVVTKDAMILLIQKRLQQGISALLAALDKDEVSEEALRGLIGLGLGLTPSGDDFLCGLLTAVNLPFSPYRNSQKRLISAVLNNLGQTHAISAAFLKDACQAQISAPVQELINQLCKKDSHLSAIELAVRQLSALGHRSGYDLLSGFLAGLPHSQHRRINLCPNIAV